MKKYRVLQVTGDSIGSVITEQQGITPQLENCNGGSSLTLLQFFEQLSPLRFLKMLLLQTSTKSLKEMGGIWGDALLLWIVVLDVDTSWTTAL